MGFVCWGGNISKLDRGRLEKIVKKASHVVGKPLDNVTTLHKKRLYRKLMQILNDPTHPMRHYSDSRRSNRGGRFLLSRTNATVIKPRFYPRLCQFQMKIIPVIQSLTECAYVKTSVSNGGLGMGLTKYIVIVTVIILSDAPR